MMLHRADDLVIFMALAGDDKPVAIAESLACPGNSFRPVFDDGKFLRMHSRDDFLDDFARNFRAGVIRSDPRELRFLFRYSAHDGTLGAVAVAAAAEHDRKFTAAKFAGREKDAFNRIRSMRVIDDHPALAIVPDHFKAARDAHGEERFAERIHRKTEGAGPCGDEEDGVHIEFADEARIERLFGKRGNGELHAVFVADHLRRLHLGDGASEAGNRSLVLHRDFIIEAEAVSVIHIDDGDAVLAEVLREQKLLRLEVVLHRLVIIQMIAGEVREKSALESDARDAALVQGMRGCFHHEIRAARIDRVLREGVKFNEARSRKVRGYSHFYIRIHW